MNKKQKLKYFDELKSNFDHVKENAERMVEVFGDLSQPASYIIFCETMKDLKLMVENESSLKKLLGRIVVCNEIDFEKMSNFDIVRTYKLFVVVFGIINKVPDEIVEAFAKKHDDRFEDIDFSFVKKTLEESSKEKITK